jgi:hypothetical protein
LSITFNDQDQQVHLIVDGLPIDSLNATNGPLAEPVEPVKQRKPPWHKSPDLRICVDNHDAGQPNSAKLGGVLGCLEILISHQGWLERDYGKINLIAMSTAVQRC